MMAVADNAGMDGSVGLGLGAATGSSPQGGGPGGTTSSFGGMDSSPEQLYEVGQSQRSNGLLGEEDDENSGRSNASNDSMRELEDLLKKLNPLAKEFVPPSRGDPALSKELLSKQINHQQQQLQQQQPLQQQRKQNGYNTGKKRYNNRQSKAQREECIRRTVYVSDIDQQVTEEQLAALFINCGQVIDCRVCGDPNSVLRFAFVEFTDEEGARQALNLAGTMLGFYPVRVLPSKTAIVPVNPTFLPRSEDERQMCARTIYCTNIDKKVSQSDVKLFFESLCGEVSRLRLLGDYHHSTRIAFVEFALAESAMAALNCSGAILGSLPIRVSPSKTPVRPRSPRPSLR
ncbi:polyadenylate-binding protein-interacting protein 8 [Selaginella moellendorffii]|nr:polyadenylate-binding protein-interacting protein 8 [Selaginella moellendorffii]XP_024536555.1 polyadenylate-binding protein-interacting protein 8 [Selaginella moellendorffii]|eukprot:XP_002968255.2 polyadenylate-binding protein-interacting protein 8 [Selaginella moellendorffii]